MINIQIKKIIYNYIYIVKNIFNRLSVEFLNQISVIITLPIIANSLGLNSFAIASEGMIIIHLILLISSWGVDGYSIESLNKINNQDEKSLFINSFFALRLIIISILLFILYFILKNNLLNLSLDFFWYLIFPIITTSFLPLWFFQAIGKAEKLLLPTLIGRTVFVIIILLFIKDQSSIKWLFISHGVSSSIIALLGMSILFRMHYKIKLPNLLNIKQHFKKSISHFVLLVVNNQFNTLWSGAIIFLGNTVSIAIFNLSNQILKAGMGISELIGRVVRQSTFNKEINHIKNVILFITFFYIVIALFFIFFINEILGYFFVDEYLEYSIIFQIIIIIWLLNGLYKVFSYAVLTKIVDITKANIISIKIGLLHIVFLILWFIFAKSYSVFSISIYILLACFVQLLILLIYIKLIKK